MSDYTFTAVVQRDTTPRGPARKGWVGSALTGHRETRSDEQLLVPGVDPIVSEVVELAAYVDSAGNANIFRGRELIASIEDVEVEDLGLALYGETVGVDVPAGFVAELRAKRAQWANSGG